MSRLLVRNEGPLDRAARVLVGTLILAMYFVGPQSPWALLGLVPLATGLLGSCPLYTLFGISTCSARSSH